MSPNRQYSRIAKLLISLGCYGGDCLRRLIVRILGRKPRATCVVLYYHALPTSKRSRFVHQMDLLRRWAKPIPADYEGPLEAGRRYVAVTFDDGFLTVLQNGLPELAERAIPCTIFVMTDFLGKIPPWAERYSDTGKLDRVVTLEELLQMPSDMVVIGSHTVTHPDLTALGAAQALAELRDSRLQLEKWLGRPALLFSFPFGAFSEILVSYCRQAGYRRVFTTLPKLAFAPFEYATGRVPVDASDWDVEFLLKLFGAYRWLPYAFSLKRAILSAAGLQPGKDDSGMPHDSVVSLSLQTVEVFRQKNELRPAQPEPHDEQVYPLEEGGLPSGPLDPPLRE